MKPFRSCATPNPKRDSLIMTYGPTLILGMMIALMMVAGMTGQFD